MVDREIFSRRLAALEGYLHKLMAFRETAEPDFVAEPARCVPLVNALVAELHPAPCEVWVYSDGLPRISWLARELARVARCGRREAKRLARQVLEFQHQQMDLFLGCLAPVHFRTEGSVDLVREVVHAFSVAPFAFAARASRWTHRLWFPAFPDLDLRDPDDHQGGQPG